MSDQRLIFVCTGNTSRSPMAKAIYDRMDEVKQLEVLSRGLVVLFQEPANPKTCAVLKNNNLDLDGHSSTELTEEDITEDTIILTMSEKLRDSVKEKFPNAKRVYAMKEFIGEEGDVIDPYGKTLSDYEDCFDEISKIVKKTIYRINEEEHI